MSRHSSTLTSRAEILLPVLVRIRLVSPIQRRPFRLVLEQPHRLGVVLLISREAMVDARRHDHEVTLLERNAHPVVVLAAHVEVATALDNVPDLLVFVQVLVEEGLDFFFVVGQRGRRDGDLVPVLVLALECDPVHVVQRAEVVVQNAQLREVFAGY